MPTRCSRWRAVWARSDDPLAAPALLPLVPRDQDVPGLRTQARAHDPAVFEQIHETAGAREPDLQLALEHRGRAELRADHELPGLLEEFVVISQAVAFRCSR